MTLSRRDLLAAAVATAEGRVLVVYWWASWCPFCAVQSPPIEKLWRAWQRRGRDGRVVLAEAGEMFPEDIEGLAKYL